MPRGSLADRDIRLIVGAVGISALGDVLLWIPLTLHIQEMTDSGIAVAALMIALWMPIVVLAPVSGLLVDRSESRRVLLLSSLAQAVIAAGLAVAVGSLGWILALAAVLGVFFSISQPAEFALVPVIAGTEETERLNRINGYVETARYGGMTAGPLLGGVLVALGGTEVALLVNAATFLVVAVAAWLLTARRPPVPAAAGEAPPRARDGIAFLFGDRTLAVVLTAAFASLLFFSASITAEVFFIREDLGASDIVYGLVFMSWTLGMVLGATVVAPRVRAGVLASGALIATIIQGLGLGAPTIWLAIGFAAAAWLVGGVGHGVKNVLVRTLIQARVPDRVHGRAFAAYNGLRNGAELIALASGGVLVAAIGARTTLAIAGAVPVVVGLAGLILLRSRSSPGPDAGAEVEPPEPSVEPSPAGAALIE